jgi:membrane protease subunit (stomatin/prohibitin family)
MPFRRRRPLLRAAAVGGVAYAAGKKGAQAGQEDPNAPADEQPQAAVDPAPATPSADESMAELTKLKELLDNGVLTQAEFDAQKQKILQSM